MNLPPFSTAALNKELVEELRRYSFIAEEKGKLTTEQLQIIYYQKWFKMFVPTSYDGLQLSLLEGLKLEEELARIDGSLGWTVTLCSGATMFVGYLNEQIANTIFTDPEVCFGGSGRAGGTAIVTENGYEVSGLWQYATGAPHNTIFTANCFIEKDGKRLTNEDGSPLVQSFFFLKKEVTVYEDWQTMGLKATAGHSFSVKNLQVAKDRTFIIDGAHATINDPVYQYPFLQFAETTLAVNTLGMTLHFLECCQQIFSKKKEDVPTTSASSFQLFLLLENAINQICSLRQQFYTVVAKSWQELIGQNIISEESLKAVSTASRSLAAGARKTVQELFPHCGLQAANPSSTINQIWRDIHTASQHSLLNSKPVV